MKKLRDIYLETQRYSDLENFKVTQERVIKVSSFIDTQLQKFQKEPQEGSIEEIQFYKRKFEEVKTIYSDSIQRNDKKSVVEGRIHTVLKQNYLPRSPQSVLPMHNMPPSQEEVALASRLKQTKMLMAIKDEQEVLEEVQKSNISSKLESTFPDPSIFKKKAKPVMNSVMGNDSIAQKDNQIKRLQAEIALLREERAKDKTCLGEINEVKQKIKHYEIEIARVTRQKSLLQAHSSEPNEKKSMSSYEEAQYTGPYSFRCRPNNIQLIERMNVSQGLSEPYNSVSSDNIENKSLSADKLHAPLPVGISPQQMQNSAVRLFQEDSFTQYEHQQRMNQIQQKIIRCKVAFFKQSMVLYRSQDFELAFKRDELANLSQVKLNLYVINRTKATAKVSINYNTDRQYYLVTRTSDPLQTINSLEQSYESLDIRFVNRQDLDSIISATVTFGRNEPVEIFIPAMLIKFSSTPVNYRFQLNLQTKVFRPHGRFATYEATESVLKLAKFESNGGVTYGKSQIGEGPVKIRWLPSGEVQVETLSMWMRYIAFLMIRGEM